MLQDEVFLHLLRKVSCVYIKRHAGVDTQI